jgi:hypothetical protein
MVMATPEKPEKNNFSMLVYIEKNSIYNVIVINKQCGGK